MKKEGVIIFLVLFVLVGVGVIIIQNKFKNSLSNKLEDIQNLKAPSMNLLQNGNLNKSLVPSNCTDNTGSYCNISSIEECSPTSYDLVYEGDKNIKVEVIGSEAETCHLHLIKEGLGMECYIPSLLLKNDFLNKTLSNSTNIQQAIISYC